MSAHGVKKHYVKGNRPPERTDFCDITEHGMHGDALMGL